MPQKRARVAQSLLIRMKWPSGETGVWTLCEGRAEDLIDKAGGIATIPRIRVES
jgi:hypothetical protein